VAAFQMDGRRQRCHSTRMRLDSLTRVASAVLTGRQGNEIAGMTSAVLSPVQDTPSVKWIPMIRLIRMRNDE
jgi:hypothetical protein